MRTEYYFRKLLDVDDDGGGGGGGDDSPRNTGSGSTFTAVPPLPSSSSSMAMAANPQFKPTLGFDSSMALTILVLLTALFFMVFFSMYLRRFADDNSFNISRRRRRPSSSSSANAAAAAAAARFDASSSFSSSNGLDPSTIRSLPLYSYDGNTTKEEPILCSVCLSEFEEKETTKVIPYCGHAFHPQCIDKWFYSHSSCPLCRSTQLFREGSGSAVKEKEKEKEKETEMMMMMMKKKKKKKKDCLVVEVNVRSSQKRVCSEHNHKIVISECESLGKSTVESGDKSIVVDDDKEINETSSGGLRRISSWAGLDEKVVLKRSSSF